MELKDVDFADFVHKVAFSVADAQHKLDLTSAEVARTLGDTTVMLPKVTQIIEKDGAVTKRVENENFSLLELGITPTFYQFSETTIEVALDFKTEETETGKLELKANTFNVRAERRLKKTVEAHSKFKTTMVPVPAPASFGDRVEIIDKSEPTG